MSKDIRSYFGIKQNPNTISKNADNKKSIQESTSRKQKIDVKRKRRRILSDSEDSDGGVSNFKLKNGKNEHSSPKKKEISNKTKSPKKNGSLETKKEIKLTNIFSSEPIKRINSLNKKHTAENSKAKVEKTISSDIGIHPDEKFNQTLIALDDRNIDIKAKIKEIYRNDSIPKKHDALEDTKHDKNRTEEVNGNKNSCDTNKVEKNKDKSNTATAKSSSPNKQHCTDKDKNIEIKNENNDFIECDVINETIYDPSPSKMNKSVDSIKSSQNDTPNKSLLDSGKKRKRKASTSISVLTDEERHEHKRYASMLYKKFLNRSGPKHLGSKEVPKGTPNCLKGFVFLITGVLDSFERNEVTDIIKEYGGEVKQTLSGKVTHLICGEDAGPSKIAKAESLNINVISEDDFLDLIRKKSCDLPEQDIKVQTKTPNTPNKEKNKIDDKKKIQQSKKTCKEDLNEKLKKHSNVVESLYFKKDDNPEETREASNKHLSTTSTLSSPKKMQVKDTSKSQWVEKYKPLTSKQIIGQNGESSNVAKLIVWLSKWYQNRKLKLPPPNPWSKGGDGGYYRAVLLSGPPGVGKTTSALLVCKELGFDIVEFNASDTRSKNLLKEHMSELTTMNTLSGFVHGTKPLTKKHAIIMDEVDGMAGNEDRGGMQELIALIKKTSVPIICICNDKTSPKMRSLSNHCFDLTYSKPKIEQIKGFLRTICFKESIKIPPQSLDEIIIGASQDIRQILNLLSLWTASNKDISTDSISKNSKSSKKDIKLGPWTVLRTVFTKEEHKHMTMSEKSDLFFHDYSLAPLFVQQNYLKVVPACPQKEVLNRFAEAADSLCIGDITERKIRNSMAWSLLPIQGMYSSVMPGSILSGHIQGLIDFPSWLGQNSRTSKINRITQEIHSHIKLSTSGSKDSIRLDYGFHIYESIIRPLINEGIDGIEKAIETLRAYHLTREDLDSLMELNSWPKKKDKMSLIDSKVKTAFTKKYNKEAILLPYSQPKTKVKSSSKEADIDDVINSESNTCEQTEENDDSDIESDVMIKKKKKPAVSAKKGLQNTKESKEKKQKTTKKK